jgi:hypothetical protein
MRSPGVCDNCALVSKNGGHGDIGARDVART